jgi:hypothetical protein
MMHAKILGTSDPDEKRNPLGEALAQRVEQLSPADRDYFGRRALQESKAARASSCPEARLAHEKLAEAYRLLCPLDGGHANPHLASELALFQFNPRPAD